MMAGNGSNRPGSRRRTFLLIGTIFVIGIVLGAFLFGGGGREAAESTEHADHDAQEDPTLWTCSMHPQIKLPEPGKCPICFMDLIPLDSGSGSTEPTQLAMSEEAMKLAEIATAPVVRRGVEKEIRALGRITVDERRLKKITAWTSGRLERLFVDFTGVDVEQGDPLVELYSPELYSAQTELLAASQAVDRLGESRSGTIRATADATIRAAREKLHLLGLSDTQIEEIESRGTAEERITIPAPIGGVVVHKNAVEGDYVKTGTPIYTIADLSKVWVILDAYESDLTWIDLGQTVTFDVEAFPGEAFTGKVAFIDPVVDPKTRTVRVRLDVENRSGRLKPDMFAHARISSDGQGGEPLVIPATAPLITGKRAVVYVRVPDMEKPTFEGREVVLGPRGGDVYVVESGLSEGELVVVKGAFKIDSEMQIQARPSMMSPDGGAPVPGHHHDGAMAAGGGMTEDSMAGEEEMVPGRNASIERAAMNDFGDPPTAVRDAVGPVLERYLAIQRALAADDVATAKQGFAALVTALGKIPAGSLSESQRRTWTMLQRDLETASRAGASVSGIDELREQFARATVAIVAIEMAIGPPRGEIHRLAHCPMAFENRGAYWVQTEEEISNPYFGEMMLRCGSIEESFEGRR